MTKNRTPERERRAGAAWLLAGAAVLIGALTIVAAVWRAPAALGSKGSVRATDPNIVFVAAETGDVGIDPGYGKDVASCTAVLRSADVVGVDIDNAYPGYTCRLMVTIVSTGDAPLMRAAPAISTVPAITVTPDDDTCGNLAPGAEWVTGYAIRINQVAEQEAIYGFTIDTRFAEAEPGTIGFWGNWDAHDTFVASDIEGWLAAIDASSDWLGPTTMSGTDELFDTARGRSTMEARFLAHYLATRLNDQAGLLCAAAGHNIRGVDPDNYLGLADPEDAGLADIITAIEAKAGTAPTRQQYEVLKSISDGLNNASF